MKKTKIGTYPVNKERGNVFFALFGAVAVVGVIGAASMSIMRGPLTTMVEVNKRTQAESQMQIAAKMAVIEAVENLSGEDCDADGAIEPIHARTGATAPANGGLIPNSFGVNKTDPWGTEYGYCVWDAGPITGDAACNAPSASEEEHLAGDGTNKDDYTVIAIISAGPDRTFDTTCNTFAAADANSNGDIDGSEKMASKPSGTDDIIIEATYAEASTFAGGLWTIKSGDPATATTTRQVEVTQDARFGGQVDLDLLGGTLLLPNVSTTACDATNNGVVARNTTTNPHTIEICDFTNGAGWVSVAAGATTVSNLNDGDSGIAVDDTAPAEISFTIDGTTEATIDATDLDAGSLNVSTTGTLDAGDTTINGTATVTGDVTLGDDTSTDTVTITAALDAQGDVDVGGNLGVSGNTTLGDDALTDTVTITASLNGQGDTDLDGALDVQGNVILGDDAADTVNITGLLTADEDVDFNADLNVDGAVNINNVGTTDPALNVTGNIDLTGDLDGDNATFTTVTVDGTGTALNVTGSGEFGGDVLANDYKLVVGASTYDFVPASCGSGSFNRWDGDSWECELDTSGGASGNATDELQNIEEVLNRGSNANSEGLENLGTTVIGAATATGALLLDVEGKVGATEYCENDDTNCFTTDQMNQSLSEVLGVGADAGGSIDLLNLSGLALGSSTISNGTNTDVRIDVTGDVAAIEFCDENGANCFDAASVSTLVSGAVTEIDDLTDAYHDTTTDFDGDMADNDDNLALGHEFPALDGTTPGARNIAIGARAASTLTTADDTVIIGYDAGANLTTGRQNTFVGSAAGRDVTVGLFNTLIGHRAGRDLLSGNNNTFIGESAGVNTQGQSNTGVGANSLFRNNTGSNNTVLGMDAGAGTTNGARENNTLIGFRAGYSMEPGSNNNVLMGYQAGDVITTGTDNIIIGYDADTSSATASNELNIGGTIFGNLASGSVGLGVTDTTGIDTSALLELDSTTRGFLMPRMTGGERDLIASPSIGLQIYNLTTSTVDYYDGSNWVSFASSSGAANALIDADLDTGIEVDTAGDGSANTTVFTNNGAETMRIDATGNVGIGTTTPSAALDVVSTSTTAATFGRANEARIRVIRSGGQSVNLGITSSNVSYLASSSNMLAFQTGGSERARFDGSSGNFGIGTQTPSEKLTLLDGVFAIREDDDEYDAVRMGAGNTTGGIVFLKDGVPLVDISSAELGPTYFNSGPVVFGNTTVDASARVQIDSTDKGFLPPRIADPLSDIATPATGLIAYDSTDNELQVYDGTSWVTFSGGGSVVVAIDDLTDALKNTTENNMFLGHEGGISIGANNLRNLGIGINALDSLTDPGVADGNGDENVAIGYDAGTNITTARQNVLIGSRAGDSVIAGHSMVLIGTGAAEATSGSDGLVAIGGNLVGRNAGQYSTIIGYGAATRAGSINNSTIIGASAGADASGSHNVFVGANAGVGVTGVSNPVNSVFVGRSSGYGITTGDNNILLGYQAGDEVTTGNNNIVIGYDIDTSDPTASNELNIGDVLFGDLANNRIGVNTSNPTSSLTVNGNFSVKTIGEANDALSITRDGSTSTLSQRNGPTTTVRLSSSVAIQSFFNSSNFVFGDTAADDSALVEIESATQGFLPPRNTDPATNIATPATGLIAYDSTDNELQVYDGTSWVPFSGGGSIVVAIDDLSDGYKDLVDNNLFLGDITGAGVANTEQNTVLGIGALTALDGSGAGGNGDANTAIGHFALNANETGASNTAIGSTASLLNTDGSNNIAIGRSALQRNTEGNNNTAIGVRALGNNSSAGFLEHNTAIGYQAGMNVEGGGSSGGGADNNIFIGFQAGDIITTGDNNIIIGYDVDASSATASNELNIGGAIFGNLSNGNIGIGKNNPGDRLTVLGGDIVLRESDDGNDAFNLSANGTTSTIEMFNDANSIVRISSQNATDSYLRAGSFVFGDNSADASALVEIESATKGFLPPRIADPSADITTPATGLIAYDSTDNELQVYDGTSWVTFSGSGGVAAAGSDREIQFNDGGNLGASSAFAYNSSGDLRIFGGGNNAGDKSDIDIFRYRGTQASPTVLADGDFLGFTRFYAYDGSGYLNTARIGAVINDGTITAGNAATDLVFQTGQSDGATSSHARLYGSSNSFVVGQDLDSAENLMMAGSTGGLIGVIGENPDFDAFSFGSVNKGDFTFTKAQGDATAPTAILDGDEIGAIRWAGYSTGGSEIRRASILGVVNGTVSGTDVPIDLLFKTTDGADDEGLERMRITSDGNIGIGTSTPNGILQIAGAGMSDNDRLLSVTEDGDSLFYVTARDGGRIAHGPSRFFGVCGIGSYCMEITNQGLRATDHANIQIVSREDELSGNHGISLVNDGLMPAGIPLLKVGIGTNAATAEYLRVDSTGGIGIGTGAENDASALMEISSTTRGFLPPRNADPATNITTPATGLIAYDSTDNELQVYDGTSWVAFSGGGSVAIDINDLTDAYHDTTTDFDGDMADNDDNLALGHEFATLDGTNPGARNTAIGATSLDALTTGDGNAAFGYNSLSNLTTGLRNAAFGENAGLGITTGIENTMIGQSAGHFGAVGSENVAVGHAAMAAAGGNNNTAVGRSALNGNFTTTITNNTALGYRAGVNIDGGSNNLFLGYQAGDLTTSGTDNIIIGYDVDVSSATASNELNIGDTIFGDLANNFVGIGTNAPNNPLHIIDTGLAATTEMLRLETTSANQNMLRIIRPGYEGGMVLNTGSSGVMRLEYGSDGIMRFDTNTDNIYFDNRIGIGTTTPDASASLDITSTDKGFLPPRIADPATDITTPATGLIAYDSTDNELQVYDGTSWVAFSGGGAGAIALDDLTDVEKDANNLFAGEVYGTPLTNAANNTSFGIEALDALTDAVTGGDDNTAFGKDALTNMEDGNQNVAVGSGALGGYVSGSQNIAIGWNALRFADGGEHNVAIGQLAGANYINSGSSRNTFLGTQAGFGTPNAENVTDNVAIGYHAGRVLNTNSVDNVVVGSQAGDALTTASRNVLMGKNAGGANQTMNDLVAIGYDAGAAVNTSAFGGPIFIGNYAGDALTDGFGTMAIGFNALTGATGSNATNTVAIGQAAMFDAGSSGAARGNLAVGDFAGGYFGTGNDNVFLGRSSGAGAAGWDGASNVFVGQGIGAAMTGGNSDNNIFIGQGVAATLTSGDNNILIGQGIDVSSTTASNELNIGDAIYGDLTNGYIGLGKQNPGDLLTLLGGKIAIRENDDENDAVYIGSGSDTGYISLLNTGVANTIIRSTVGAESYFNAGPVVFGNTTADASAKVQIDATAQGFLPPRIADPATDITTPATGLIAYDSTDNELQVYDGTSWVTFSGGSAGAIAIDDLTDAKTDVTSVFLGNGAGAVDNGNNRNTAVGVSTMAAIDGGEYNTAIGHLAMTLTDNGGSNVAVGYNALAANVSRSNNVAVGRGALELATNANTNIAIGFEAMSTTTTGGINNVGIGQYALDNVGGDDNIAIGDSAGIDLTTASQNIFIGTNAGSSLTTTGNNVLIGYVAGNNTTTSYRSVAIGDFSGQGMGYQNTFIGERAGRDSTSTATDNTFVGRAAGQNFETGNGNILIGTQSESASFTSGSNNILIGYFIDPSAATASNELNIGNTIFGDLTNAAADGTGAARLGINNTAPTAALEINYAGTASDDASPDPALITLRNTGTQGGAAIQLFEENSEQGFEIENYTSADSLTNYLSMKAYPNDPTPVEFMRVHRDNQEVQFRNMTVGGPASYISQLRLMENVDASEDGFIFEYDGVNNIFHMKSGTGGTYPEILTIGRADRTIGIGTAGVAADASAQLEIASATRGFLPPRNTDPATNITTPATGLIAYDSTDNELQVYNGTAWEAMSGASAGAIAINDLTDATTTTDSMYIGSGSGIVSTGVQNTVLGIGAMVNNTTGANNVFIGWEAGGNAARPDNPQTGNTAIGARAGSSISGGDDNVLIGRQAGQSIQFGSRNIVLGLSASTSSINANDELNIGDTIFGDLSTDRIGIGVTDATAIEATAVLQADATDKGFLPPRISDPSADITTPATGLIAYDSTDNELQVYNGTAWEAMSGASAGAIAINDLSDATTDYVSNFNMFVGQNAGSSITTGQYNILIGQSAGNGLTDETNNVIIGYQAAPNVESGTTAVGSSAGANATGFNNTFLGNFAGLRQSGESVAIGNSAGGLNNGNYNVFVGSFAGQGDDADGGNGSNNSVMIGYHAGQQIDEGNNNIFVGYQAGNSTTDGSNNIIVGYDIDASSPTASNELNIGNAIYGDLSTGNVGIGVSVPGETLSVESANTSDIFSLRSTNAFGWASVEYIDSAGATAGWMGYGNTSAPTQTDQIYIEANGTREIAFWNDGTQRMVIDGTGNVGIGNATPDVALDVTGDIEYSGTLTDVSDRRLKTDIHKLDTAEVIEKLAQIDTYTFKMKDDVNGRVEYGVMAQDIEKLFPELVKTANDEIGTKSVNYMGLIAPMIEASKALKEENETLKAEMAMMRSQQTEILAALSDMKEDVAGIKLHTNYGIQKAAYENGPLMIIMMLFGGAIVFFAGGLRRRS